MKVGTDHPAGLSERVFRALLHLFPADFREHFAGEMRAVFHEQQGDARAAGRLAYVRFCWETGRGLVGTAFREHREILFQDMDYALRLMRKERSFTVAVITILGMAIGAMTAVFMAANAILIQPLPFSGGNHLIHLQQRRPGVGIENMPFSVKEIADYRSQNHTLDSVVEFHEMTFSLLGGREPERVDTGVVSANFFRVLGVTPLYGRTFMDEDDTPGARPVLILSYNFWQRAFGGDRNVVGQKYSMNDKEHVVVGILPPIPQFPAEVDVYMPTVACPTRSGERALHDRSWHMMNVFATLKPGVSMAEARRDVNRIAERLRTTYPQEYPSEKGYEIELQPMHEELSARNSARVDHPRGRRRAVVAASLCQCHRNHAVPSAGAYPGVDGSNDSRGESEPHRSQLDHRGSHSRDAWRRYRVGLFVLEPGPAGRIYFQVHESRLTAALHSPGHRLLQSAVAGLWSFHRNGAGNRSSPHASVHHGTRQCQPIESNQCQDA